MKGVFLYRPDSIYEDVPDVFYRFPSAYLSRAQQFVGDWVVYMEPAKAGVRGYHAVAKEQQIAPEADRPGMYKALIEPQTYLELGRDVPFRRDGMLVEQGVLNEEGKKPHATCSEEKPGGGAPGFSFSELSSSIL